MANTKISALTSATTPLAGTEVLPIVQSGATVKVANNDLRPKQIQSNATTGVLQVAGPAAAATRTMTVPDANFTVARTDAANSFTGDQTLSTGNLVQGTAAKGVNFTANTPAAGMTSQLLNWYEEGTWTPTIEGDATAGTYQLDASTSSTYTRIGRQVTLIAYIKLAGAITAGGTGDMRILGVPFVSAGGNAFSQGAVVMNGVNYTAGAGLAVGFAGWGNGQNSLYVRINNANAAPTFVPISGVSASDYISFTFTYTA